MKLSSFFNLMFVISVLFTNCNIGSAKIEDNTHMIDHAKNPDYQKGLEIISKSNCNTCHKIDEKLTGPAFRDIANKYAVLPDTIISHLARKILQGGGGVWGEVPMVAHPDLSQEQAEAAVKYIFLLKQSIHE